MFGQQRVILRCTARFSRLWKKEGKEKPENSKFPPCCSGGVGASEAFTRPSDISVRYSEGQGELARSLSRSLVKQPVTLHLVDKFIDNGIALIHRGALLSIEPRRA